MTQKDLFQTVTSSQPAIRASHLVLPGSKEAQKMTATSGLKYEPLLKQSDPIGAFSKTFMVTSSWDSTRCYLIWKPLATPQGRLLFQLAVSMLPTNETESGLLHTPTAKGNQDAPSMRDRDRGSWWATPNTMDHLPQRSEESTKKMQEGHRKGRKRPSNLREQVDEETIAMWPTPTAMTGGTGVAPSHKNGKHGWNTGAAVNDSLSDNPTRMWPTPRASSAMTDSTESVEKRVQKAGYEGKLEQAARMWPTPTANEDAAGTPNGKMQRMLGNDPGVRGVSSEEWKRGALNPTWVEWLMGYPEGWTELED